MYKKLTIFDFENGENGLIEYLKTLSEISRIEIHPLTYEISQDEDCVEVEFELISFNNLRHIFPNVEIIENDEVSLGKCRMIVR
jgi:hypothetical protein